jgi:hypothetical protein
MSIHFIKFLIRIFVKRNISDIVFKKDYTPFNNVKA